MAEKKHVIEYTDIIKAFETVKEKLKNKSNKGHQHGNADITDIDASKIKSGTIDIDRLPKGAIERMVYVKDDAARFALTTNTTQNGDTVKVTSTKKMFYVIDDTKLSSEAGYEPYTAESASAVVVSPADRQHLHRKHTLMPYLRWQIYKRLLPD